uniref:Glucose-methanol-choline oxidoreductase N-terminal domain-containing protein n=1 Tax=Timema tahoe TaxID=61484 RepID=A0A7R9IAL8_9NEOP|nr:unnamed protein product [Timema tahoe]
MAPVVPNCAELLIGGPHQQKFGKHWSKVSISQKTRLPMTGRSGFESRSGVVELVILFFTVYLQANAAVGQARMSSIVTLPITLVGAAANAASSVAWFLPMLVAAIAYFHYELHDPESRPIDVDTELLYPQYDFIVVGAGSAGAVVANRLTEIEPWTVLLLEAGGDETEISDVPLLAAYLQLSKLDWKYKTEPQGTACLGHTNDFPRPDLSYKSRGCKSRTGDARRSDKSSVVVAAKCYKEMEREATQSDKNRLSHMTSLQYLLHLSLANVVPINYRPTSIDCSPSILGNGIAIESGGLIL